MKLIPSLSLVAAALAISATAQNAPANRPTPPAPTISPEIQPDHHVIFRLKAPQASEVSVSGQGFQGKVAMTKNESGEWSATVGPVEPGIYEYSFTIDGVQVIDPGNSAIKPQRQPKSSILHIPGTPPLVWDFQDVPHGTVHQHTYLSKTVGAPREFYVYTPPGYEKDTTSKYPVLYLIHGFGDNDAGWTQHGKAHWILDNLIAQGKARPMVIVMPDGHPIAPGAGFRDEYGKANAEALEKEIVTEMLPMIETTYRVKNDAGSRAIAGLSMGGGHSLHTGFRHMDAFAWIGAFSAGVSGQDQLLASLTDAKAVNGKLKLLWIACGKSDFLIERNRQLDKQLTDAGIRHTWVETDGDHSWPVWRRYLAEFAPLLFTES